MTEDLIPIVMFLSIAVVLIFVFWFRFRAREGMQQTIRQALDKGHELTPEIIERLGHPKPSKHRDLRLGVIWLAVAVGFAVMAFSVGHFAEEALYGTLSTAGFPFAIGVGYLLLYWLTGKDDK